MANNDILDDLGDAKKYLEEVMGIVEDEEFNRERRKKLRLGQQQEKKQTVNFDDENNESGLSTLLALLCTLFRIHFKLLALKSYGNTFLLLIRNFQP